MDYIAYETNVTNISSIDSGNFNILPFNSDYGYTCCFKKIYWKQIMILCNGMESGLLHLEEIKEEIKLTSIKIKYNFLILPKKNKENFNSKF